ncbi:hypothetical protein BD1_26 [Octadecabacter Antarctic BD virus 1]|nr:hypothetical protein BD1_26 [Octadecabacter Antarctic BD virus 1]
MTKLYAIIAAASLTMSGVSYLVADWRGYNRGVADTLADAEAARLVKQRQLFRLGEQIATQALELQSEREERKALANDLENQALSAPDADAGGISPDGMRRIQQRWDTR